MNVINTQPLHSTQALQGLSRTASAKETPQTVARDAASPDTVRDAVQFSAEALNLGKIERTESSSSGIRFDLVNRVKAEIAAGVYDSPEKMNIALDRMIGQM